MQGLQRLFFQQLLQTSGRGVEDRVGMQRRSFFGAKAMEGVGEHQSDGEEIRVGKRCHTLAAMSGQLAPVGFVVGAAPCPAL